MGMMRSNCVGLTHVEMVGWFSLGLVIFPKAELAGKRERLVTDNSGMYEEEGRDHGKRKDRNKEDREHNESPSDILQEKEWSSQEGL
ncbi:hypothetical protein K1719_024685 [Acacia pycnantha]|nr:hypothetical protein K1719_024685 [Acacia pycnantha]